MYQKFKDISKRLSSEGESNGRCSALVQEFPAHWNSYYDMLDKIVKLRTPIQVLLSNSDLVPSTSEWHLMEELATILKPLKLMAGLLSGHSYPRMSSVYPILIGPINKHLQTESGDTFITKIFKKLLKEKLKQYFGDKTQ